MSLLIHRFFYSAESVETRTGFDDNDLTTKVKKIPFLRRQVESVAYEGFHYVGDTQESNKNSKAYTDPGKKWIFIGKKKTTEEAVLSLSYEITNAKNGKKLSKIYKNYSMDSSPGKARAENYAKAILRKEAHAVYVRSQVAIALGQESLIKNVKYLEIVKEKGKNRKVAEKEIFEEMLVHGTVHQGTKSAFEHYVNQYWQAVLD